MDNTTISAVKVCLAPMAGITDRVFRDLCFEYGCDGATTEMVSAQGYITAPKERNAYQYLLSANDHEGPLAVQLFGDDPAHFHEAAARLTELNRFCGIDINMGCPAPKIVGGGAGSALLKAPLTAERIVRETVKATTLPVTVKMRIGWDESSINAVPFAQMLESAGAAALTVHGRTRDQQYSGRADWYTIAKVRDAVRIPVIANGDITDAASALECMRVTGCNLIAVGRGALGRPYLFGEIKSAVLGRTYIPPARRDILALAMRHAEEMASWLGEKPAVLEMRKHFGWYITGMRGAARLRPLINTAHTLDEVRQLLSTLDTNGEEQGRT